VPIFPRSIWMLLAALGGLIGLQAFLPELTGRAAAPPATPSAVAVDFVGNAPIELSQLSARSASATVLVRNDSEQEADIQIEAMLLDRSGHVLGSASQKERLQPFRVTAVTLSVSPANGDFDLWRDRRLPARGSVVLMAKGHGAAGGPATVKSRDLIVLQVQPSSAELLITLSGLAGAIVLALYGLAVSGRSTVDPAKSAPGWSPQSWSTNLAIGGALLTTLLGIAALPAQTHHAARTSYIALSAFFATLVTLAPAVYGLLKVGSPPTPGGALRLFALAAAVTVWATVGQLGLGALLFLELSLARVISPPAAYAAAALFDLVAVLVFVYALRAVGSYATRKPAVTGQPTPPPAVPQPWALL
jgi:hypothetical protein